MKNKKKGLILMTVLVLMLSLGSVNVYAATNDPISVVNNLSNFIFSLIRAIGIILLGAAVLNILRMAAAPWPLQARVVLLPLLMLLVSCTDVPGVLLLCTLFKLLAAWVAAAPLRLLADFAPRIISMPEPA